MADTGGNSKKAKLYAYLTNQGPATAKTATALFLSIIGD
jgi:hypothetical protein